MKLAISNIAWEQHDEPAVLKVLRQRGVGGIEIALLNLGRRGRAPAKRPPASTAGDWPRRASACRLSRRFCSAATICRFSIRQHGLHSRSISDTWLGWPRRWVREYWCSAHRRTGGEDNWRSPGRAAGREVASSAGRGLHGARASASPWSTESTGIRMRLRHLCRRRRRTGGQVDSAGVALHLDAGGLHLSDNE